MGEVTEGSFNLCKAQVAEPWLGEGWEVWRWGGESNTTYGGGLLQNPLPHSRTTPQGRDQPPSWCPPTSQGMPVRGAAWG